MEVEDFAAGGAGVDAGDEGGDTIEAQRIGDFGFSYVRA